MKNTVANTGAVGLFFEDVIRKIESVLNTVIYAVMVPVDFILDLFT